MLATLYEKGNMPAGLVKAHVNLDKAVDGAYGYKGKTADPERVIFYLNAIWHSLTSKNRTRNYPSKRSNSPCNINCNVCFFASIGH